MGASGVGFARGLLLLLIISGAVAVRLIGCTGLDSNSI